MAYRPAYRQTFLNERLGFHEVDGLIVALIIGACVLTLVGMSARIALILLGVAKSMAVVFLIMIFGLGLPIAILTIAFAVKLLRLGADLGGLLKPYAYVNLAAAVCFATMILAPVGLLLDAGGNIMLGMIFLRSPHRPETPEFV